ncbi:uncharacterized protein BcabD6B2_47010 [Babesia caballi]|uniref:6-Cys domain-containing protein n=1 Tax=Babesia caballi TaxID=5871 RepID=A0AAV4LYH9_BABCB|nr:hypothetical protein, conserved [Babesia caballi]
MLSLRNRCCSLTVTVTVLIFVRTVFNVDVCDFDAENSIGNNAAHVCLMNCDEPSTCVAYCPRNMGGKGYMWHPASENTTEQNLVAYAGDLNGAYRLWLHMVPAFGSFVPPVTYEENRTRTRLTFHASTYSHLVMTEERLLFICGPSDMELSERLLSYLTIHAFQQHDETIPWTADSPIVNELKRDKKGLGLLYVTRMQSLLPMQGCGSVPFPPFGNEADISINIITGMSSCVVNSMSTRPIVFVCEGRLEPPDCMTSVLNERDEIVKVSSPRTFISNYNDERSMVISLFKTSFNPLSGYCRCVDPATGAVKAKIEFRSQREYVCDITSKLFRHRIQRIRGNWCSVVLYPGSSLTIKFPVDQSNFGVPADGSEGAGTKDEGPYPFSIDFSPTDLSFMKVGQWSTGIDSIEDVEYHKVLAGDALELDVSQISKGEVKLIYNSGRPLSLIGNINSFFFIWNFVPSPMLNLAAIHALVNVVFVMTED